MNYNLSHAIDDPRLQHTFSPNEIRNENGYLLQENIVDGLKAKGHTVKRTGSNAIIQGIFVDKVNNTSIRIYAKSDKRKEGKASGY